MFLQQQLHPLLALLHDKKKKTYQRLKEMPIIPVYICAHKMTGSYDLTAPNCVCALRLSETSMVYKHKKELNFTFRDKKVAAHEGNCFLAAGERKTFRGISDCYCWKPKFLLYK